MQASPKYRLFPKQKQAMRLFGLDWRWQHPYGWAVEEMLYGGEAGGGKSALARCMAFTLCHIWPGARVPIFRRTYPELEDTHIVKVMTEWAGSGSYHGGSHEWRFHNGSVVPFRHCEREADVYRYMSAEWEGLVVDEATQFTQFQISTLRSRVRATRPRWRPVILYTANPGGVGHVYFKDNFVDASGEGQVFTAPKAEGGMRRVFLRAKLSDNPALPSEYKRQLEAISDPDLRKALMEGDWDIFSGQFFRLWRREKHVCNDFALPDSWYRRFIGVDWGYGAPWCSLFFARDEDLWQGQRIPRFYAYREFYSPGVRDQQQARLVRDAMENDSTWRNRSAPKLVWDCVADPSMWTSSSQTGVSPADIYQAAGIPLMPANNDRVNGWQRMMEYLDDMEDELPGVIFMENCIHTARTIPVLQRDRGHPEDLDTKGEDHAADTCRYFLMTQSGLVRREGLYRTGSYGINRTPVGPPSGGVSNATTQKMFERQLAAAASRPTGVSDNKGTVIRHGDGAERQKAPEQGEPAPGGTRR
jgi:phage terminase large subunit